MASKSGFLRKCPSTCITRARQSSSFIRRRMATPTLLQPLEPIREIASHYDSLLLVDAVTSLGSHPLRINEMGVDICYSCTQKGLGAPPGRHPSPCLRERSRFKEPTWLPKLVSGSGNARFLLGKRESLSSHGAGFVALCSSKGSRSGPGRGAGTTLESPPKEPPRPGGRYRIPWIKDACIARTPALVAQHAENSRDGVDDVQVRGQLLQDFNLEIGSGLGELKGTIWRVGLMGENSSPETVLYFLYALENSTSGLEAFRVNLARVSRPPHNTTAQQPERERLRPVLARRNDGAKVELLKESGTIGASLVRRGSERVAPEPQCS